MDDAEYFALPCLSNSDLSSWARGTAKDADDRNLFLGTIFHRMVLEPQKITERVQICDHRRNTKLWKAFLDEHPDADVLTTGEYDSLMGMKLSIEQHPEIGKVLEHARANREQCEVVVIGDIDNVRFKCKIDQLGKSIIDWKSTGCLQAVDFAANVPAFDYDCQAYLYRRILESATGEVKPFAFICVSKRRDAGNPCWIHPCDDATLASGERMAMRMLGLWARHNTTHPAFGAGIPF